jgi:hypothetical protein
MRILFSVGFVTHVALGSFCMMPMVMAADMPPEQNEAMEMNMTPMAPMSPLHCEHCTHVDQQNSNPMSNCAGHCLAKAHDSISAIIPASSVHHLAVALVPAFLAINEPPQAIQKIASSTAPPLNLALVRSVVMLQ